MPTPRPYRDGWRVQIQKDGIQASRTFKLKREALDWINKQESRKTLRSRTLRSACDHYLKTVSVQKRDAVAWETSRFADLCDYEDPELGLLGVADLGDIDSAAIGRWRDWKLTTVTGSTVLRYMNLYRNLFNLAHKEWKWISEYPFEGVRLPPDGDPREAIWRVPQILRIIRAGRKSGGKILEVTQAFHIALRTGMRLQEALAAPNCFDPARRVCDLPSTKTEKRGEKVPLTTAGYKLMLKMPKFKVEPNEASTLFSKLCKQQLVQGLQFKDSRATALTHMARKMDILTLARISRHKDLDLLRRVYYRETAEDIAKRL